MDSKLDAFRTMADLQHFPALSVRSAMLLFFLPVAVFSAGPSQCFWLDGTSASDHQPCIPAEYRSNGNHSSCCILGQPVGNSDDICTTGGLCFQQRATSSLAWLYQGGCTDSTLSDASCRQYCAPDTSGTFPERRTTHRVALC